TSTSTKAELIACRPQRMSPFEYIEIFDFVNVLLKWYSFSPDGLLELLDTQFTMLVSKVLVEECQQLLFCHFPQCINLNVGFSKKLHVQLFQIFPTSIKLK